MAYDTTGGLTLDMATEVLAAQPFSSLLGAQLTTFGRGEATLELDVRDDLLQQNGYLHGGVLAYAADNSITFAGGSSLGPSVLTSGLTISYLRPAQGNRLRARAQVIHASRRQATCRCDLQILDDDGVPTLCAAAQGTIIASGNSGHSAAH
ncbi:uncharacterized protein (TIGR00369 family) [Haloactinopolyspora alba]|uniref:Medium/long-chain acyl-CoA thioesterase YigI n=1 Tax=Haloactinopolyspora alba TaxID=648780 RepID=A0A2P8E545_9ACTN|nr:PaaI family thioesterase [Haloactinopolyspora alba]PSL04588.1 uncharacterized protein (TIGR00369 family) [Haloactinopolyspora alba]